MDNNPMISVIIPIRNEERYLKECVESILNFDYPKSSLEVLFVDGMSEDRSVEILQGYIKEYPYIRLLKNEAKIVPPAMNMAIKEAKGEYICRLDAHASYPSNYLSILLFWSQKLDADNVGAIWRTMSRGETTMAKAIAFVMADKFGVGDSLFRIGLKEVKEVDTVPFGFYKKEVFERIGLYDTRLVRVQDLELNKRLKASGGRIYLIPEVELVYYSRDTLGSFIKNRFLTGKWVILASFFTNSLNTLNFRHFIPLLFITLQLFLLFLSLFSLDFLWGVVGILALYSIILTTRALVIQKSLKKALYSLIAYMALHLSYGIGSWAGIGSVLHRKIKEREK
jgi:glycosyltransferase involved in cell wall biosynthesis